MNGLTRARAAAILMCLLATSPVAGQTLPTVAVLSTGGTIASRHNPEKGGYEPALSAEDLIAAIPALKKVAQIHTHQIANISSSDMTPQLWLRLSTRVNELLSQTDIAGVVVTHGTNTLEETAYFLDLTVTSSKPVVLVGAQRPASDPDADGPRNLLDAIRVATSPDAAGKGAMVVMNGQINAARDVTKTNTSQVETFRSLEFGALGVVDVEAVRFYRSPLRRQTFPADANATLPRIEIVASYAGADGRFIRSLVRDGDVGGIVVAGLGLGGVPAAMFDAIQEARTKGIPVVVGTRVPTGRVFALSASKGSALSLKAIGCVLADNLSPQKARVLLMLAMTRTRDSAALPAILRSLGSAVVHGIVCPYDVALPNKLDNIFRRWNRMAKVSTTVSSSIAAPRAPFYAWLIPGVFYNQLETVLRDEAGLPGVTRTTGTTGPWDVAGSTRIVHLSDGTFCRETVKVATAPDYFAYRLTEFSSRLIGMLVREANGQWWFTDEGAGTQAKWTYTAESRSVLAMPILIPVIRILWHRYMGTAMKHIKARAEKEVMGVAR